MSSNNSFGGKLRKVLASMCSLFVGASGVSQAVGPGTGILVEPKLGYDANTFGFGDIGWKLASDEDDANKENSWLSYNTGCKYQRISEVNRNIVDVGFQIAGDQVSFCVWYLDSVVSCINVPKGILFDVMRYFEDEYFPDEFVEDRVEKLSCAKGELNDSTQDEVFLRFILWAFCGSDNAIKSNHNANFDELGEDILNFVINVDNPSGAGGKFKPAEASDDRGTKKKCAVLKPGYLLENFNVRVREVYNDLGCDMTSIGKMVTVIAQLNAEKVGLQQQIAQLNADNLELQRQIAQLNAKEQNLHLNGNNIDVEKQNLLRRCEELEADKAKLLKRCDTLAAKNEMLENQLEFNNKDEENLEKQITQLNNDKKGLEKQITQLNNDKKGLEQQIAQLNANIDQLNADHNADNLELQRQIGQLNNAKENLQRQIGQLNNKKGDLEKQIAQLNNANAGLQGQITQLNNEKRGLQGQIDQLSNEKRGWEQQIARLDDEKRDLDGRIGQLNNEKEGLRQQIAQLDNDKEVLGQRIVQLSNEKEGWERQIAQLNADKEKLESQKRISYALGALIGLIGGGALVEGAHRFLGAKRSGSSEVNKGEPSINNVNKGKTSSNEKGGQKTKKNLKKQKS